MKQLLLSSAAALAAVLLPATALTTSGPIAGSPSPVQPRTGDYVVDPDHSTALFKARHLGISNFYGVFNDFSGEVHWDRDRPAESHILFKLVSDSIDSRDEQRNGHLMSPDFLNAKEFPEIVFESTGVRTGKAGYLIVTGDLTVRGVTKPIDVTVELTGAGERGERFGYRAGFEGRFTIRGKDFEMAYVEKFPEDMVGHEIEIVIALEAQLKK